MLDHEGEYARCYVHPNVTKADLLEMGIDLSLWEHEYWLLESKESFHGRFIECDNGKVFKFYDNRFSIPVCLLESQVIKEI